MEGAWGYFGVIGGLCWLRGLGVFKSFEGYRLGGLLAFGLEIYGFLGFWTLWSES